MSAGRGLSDSVKGQTTWLTWLNIIVHCRHGRRHSK